MKRGRNPRLPYTVIMLDLDRSSMCAWCGGALREQTRRTRDRTVAGVWQTRGQGLETITKSKDQSSKSRRICNLI